MDRTVAVGLIVAEYERARVKFAPFNCGHEGYAVILEELDELWEDVKKGNHVGRENEAVQVAAMALRFLVDLC